MSASKLTILLLIFSCSLSAQLPDYFEFVDDFSGYTVLRVHPFQGGMLYALGSNRMDRFDDGKVIHVKADGSYSELELYIDRIEGMGIRTYGDSLALFYTTGNSICDNVLGNFLYEYNGQEVNDISFFGYGTIDAIFNPEGDSLYVLDSEKIYTFSSSGKYIREIDVASSVDDPLEGFFYYSDNFYGINSDDEIINAVTGEVKVSGQGQIQDYKLFGDVLVVYAAEVVFINASDFNIIFSIERDGFPNVPRNKGQVITQVDEDYIFLSELPDRTTRIQRVSLDGSVESLRSDKRLPMEFVHYDGAHWYTGHSGGIIRKSQELLKDYEYHRTDLGIEFLSASSELVNLVRTLSISVALRNNSTTPIEKTTVWTSAIDGGSPFCGNSFFEFIVEQEILPGETIRVDTSMELTTVLNELMVSAYGADNLLDADHTDNEDTGALSSIRTFKEGTIRAFPIPTNNLLTIDIEKTGEYSFVLFNAEGSKVKTGFMAGTDPPILDLEPLPSGLYFLSVVDQLSPSNVSLIKVVKW